LYSLFPGAQNADEGGVHDADQHRDESGAFVGKVSLVVGEVLRECVAARVLGGRACRSTKECPHLGVERP
jgi:hypothetical protein